MVSPLPSPLNQTGCIFLHAHRAKLHDLNAQSESIYDGTEHHILFHPQYAGLHVCMHSMAMDKRHPPSSLSVPGLIEPCARQGKVNGQYINEGAVGSAMFVAGGIALIVLDTASDLDRRYSRNQRFALQAGALATVAVACMALRIFISQKMLNY